MTNSINDAIASQSAHDLAEALASAGASAERNGNRNLDEACHIHGYGTVFFRDSGWVVRDYTTDCEDPIDVTELADELAEIVEAVQRIS